MKKLLDIMLTGPDSLQDSEGIKILESYAERGRAFTVFSICKKLNESKKKWFKK